MNKAALNSQSCFILGYRFTKDLDEVLSDFSIFIINNNF